MAKTWATKCCSGTYKNNYQLCCGIKENVKVDTVRQFINRLSNVENFQANEVSATILLHKEAPSIDLDKLYKQKAE